MTMLDVKYIKNANAAWARTDLGPLGDLTKSIKQDGIRRPLLIRKDYLMIDGARRFTVAVAQRMPAVPVIFVEDWPTLAAHFDPAAPDSLPMNWPDLLEFWNNVLTPLYRDQRYSQGVATRKATNDTGEAAARPVYSAYTRHLATLYKTEPATIKLFRDYFLRLQKASDQFPGFYKGVLDAMPTGEEARNLAQSRFIKSLMERLGANEITEEEAVISFKMRLRQGTEKRSFRRATPTRLDRNAPPATLSKVDKFVGKLEEVTFQATDFMNFALTPDEAAECDQRMAQVLSQLGAMRRRMAAAIRVKEKKEQD